MRQHRRGRPELQLSSSNLSFSPSALCESTSTYRKVTAWHIQELILTVVGLRVLRVIKCIYCKCTSRIGMKTVNLCHQRLSTSRTSPLCIGRFKRSYFCKLTSSLYTVYIQYTEETSSTLKHTRKRSYKPNQTSKHPNIIFFPARESLVSHIPSRKGGGKKKVLEIKERKRIKERQGNILSHMYTMCAADFSLLNLPKGKSLGRSKPATNS
jgi:hypothetical protein